VIRGAQDKEEKGQICKLQSKMQTLGITNDWILLHGKQTMQNFSDK